MNQVANSTLPILETPRLILRPMATDDAQTVIRWRNARHVAIMSRETTNRDLSINQHLAWFAATRQDRTDYIIELKHENTPIGSVSFTLRSLTGFVSCAELGKYIGEETAQGHGYATEAVRSWIYNGFEGISLNCIFARTRRINLANIKINQRLGFTIEDFPVEFKTPSEKWIFMRLTKDQWLRQNFK